MWSFSRDSWYIARNSMIQLFFRINGANVHRQSGVFGACFRRVRPTIAAQMALLLINQIAITHTRINNKAIHLLSKTKIYNGNATKRKSWVCVVCFSYFGSTSRLWQRGKHICWKFQPGAFGITEGKQKFKVHGAIHPMKCVKIL